MNPEEEKQRELAHELKRLDEPLIATAIESAIGCRLENGVLYLQYSHPSVNNFILEDSRRKPALDAVAKQIGIEVQVL
jgi:hypothetical protein